MTLAILSAKGGRTKTQAVVFAGGGGPSGPAIPDPPEAIAGVTFNESQGGNFTATPYTVVGQASGGITYRATGITVGSSFCASFDGQSGTNVVFPHHQNWQLRPPAQPGQIAVNITNFTWNINIQPTTIPASAGDKMVIAAKDRPGMPAGISWELRNVGGTVYLYLYMKDSLGAAQFVLDSGDAQTIAAGTAYRATLTWETGVGAKAYVNDTLVNTVAACDIGLHANDADLIYGDHNNGGAPYHGRIDDAFLYDGAMTLAQVQAQDDAQTDTPGGDPDPVDVLACLSRPTPAGVDDSLSDLGNFTAQQFLNAGDGPATKYDGDGSTGILTWNGSSWSNQFFWRFGAVHDGGCVSRLKFRSNITIHERWGIIYQNPDGGQLYIRDQNCRNFSIGACRFHGGWDPIRFGHKSGVVIELITIHDIWQSLTRDDAIENDLYRDQCTYRNLLIDGCFSGFSYRGSGNGNDRINTIESCIIRMRPMHWSSSADYRHGMPFKLTSSGGGGPQLIIKNCVLYFEKPAGNNNGPGNGSDGGNMLFDLIEHGKNANAASDDNNRIIWGGAATYGSYAANWGSLPTGWSIEEEGSLSAARALYENYRAAWIAARPDVPTLGAPYDNLDWTNSA